MSGHLTPQNQRNALADWAPPPPRTSAPLDPLAGVEEADCLSIPSNPTSALGPSGLNTDPQLLTLLT